MIIEITRLSSTYDIYPVRTALAWADFVELFAVPRRMACSQETCLRSACLYKRQGPCWSPAVYTVGEDRRRKNVESISLLVFDIDQVVDDQVDEICGRFGGYRHLIHTTHSDRPGSRAMRVIVALSRPVLREEWSLLWRLAKQLFGPVVDQACADVRRLYFLPSCPHDAGYLVQANDGALLDVQEVLATESQTQPIDHATLVAESTGTP